MPVRKIEEGYTTYNTRRFRKDLHTRVKIYSVQQGCTMEEAMNLIVERGLQAILAEMRAARGGE